MNHLGLAASIALLFGYNQPNTAIKADWSGYWHGTVRIENASAAFQATPVFYRFEQNGGIVSVFPACDFVEPIATLEINDSQPAYFRLAKTNEVAAQARYHNGEIEVSPLITTAPGEHAALSTSADAPPFVLRAIHTPKCSIVKSFNGDSEVTTPVQQIKYKNPPSSDDDKNAIHTSAYYNDPCAPNSPVAGNSICTNLAAARYKLFPIGAPTLPTPSGPSNTCADQVTSVQCVSTPMTQTAVADLSNQLAFAQSTYLYPGNILKGGSYIQGNLDPVRLPRTGGTLSFTGLVFGGERPTYQVNVEETSNGSVTEAINRVLAQPITGTTAALSSSFEQVFDQHSLDVALGITVTFGGRYMNDFQFNKTTTKNVYVAKFTQNYYVVGYDMVRPPASMFAQGPNNAFDDTLGDLTDENGPPLIVDQVTYGVQYILFIESQYDKTTVQNTLNAAIGGISGNAPIEVNSNVTYNDVVSSATAYYIAFGGSSAVARTPLLQVPSATDPQSGVIGLFGGFRELLSQLSTAQASPSNPGAPIAFSVKYLASGNSASLAYTTSFIQKNCSLTPANAGTYTVNANRVYTQSLYASFAAKVDNDPDYTFDVNNQTTNLQLNQAYTAATELETGPGIPMRGTHTVHFTFTSAAFNYAVNFDLLQDGVRVLSANTACTHFFCPVRKVMTLDVDVNRVIKNVALRKAQSKKKMQVTPWPVASIPSCTS